MTRKNFTNKNRKTNKKNSEFSTTTTTMLPHRAPMYKPLSDRYKVRLGYTTTRNLNIINVFQGFTYGVFDVGGNVPKYWNQFFALYRYAYIHGIQVKAEYANIGVNSFSCALGESNSTDSPALTMKKLSETPRTQWKQCIPNGNHAVVSFNRSVNGAALVGHQVSSDQDYFTQLAIPPSVPFLPQLVLAHEPTVLAAPFSAILTVSYYIDVEFFTLNPQ